jgi:hypothetical protein
METDRMKTFAMQYSAAWWTIGPDGLVATSQGHFDDADYQRQLNGDVRGNGR